MFCNNCGKQLADGIKFCDSCGTKVHDTVITDTTTEHATTGLPPKKKKGLIISIASVLAVIVIAVCAFLVFSPKKYDTAEDVASDFVTAIYTRDAETVVDCIPPFFMKMEFGTDDKKTVESIMKSQIFAGDIASCVVINSVRDYSNSTYEEYMEDIGEDYGAGILDIASIKDVCIVTVNAIVNGDNETLEVLCVKYNDSWYALDLD